MSEPAPSGQPREHIAFGSILKDTIAPRTWCLYVFHLAALMKALWFWMGALRAHTGADLTVLSLYRPPLPSNDIQYYPLIAALSRFNFGDPALLEHYRHGFGIFPIFCVLPHALCFALFGRAGFLVGDVVCTLLFFFLVATLLRMVGFGSLVGRAVALVASTPALLSIWQGMRDGTGLVPPYTMPELWGDRIPRPFVTDIALVFMLCALVALATSPARRESRSTWIVLGVATGILIQSDVYGAMGLLPVAMMLLVGVLVRERKIDRDSLRPLLWFGAATLLCCIPFLVQSAFAHPDLSRRMGLYSLPRHLIWPPKEEKERLNFIIASYLALRFLIPYPDRRTPSALSVLALSSVFTYYGMTYSILLLGKTIQPYHFRPIWSRVSTITLLVFGLIVAREFARLIRKRLPWPRVRKVATIAALACLLAGSCWFGVRSVVRNPAKVAETNVRHDFGEYSSLKTYRNDFIALVDELRRPAYRDAKVLGTLDHQLFVWWVTFQHRFSFMTDPFVSTVPDRIIESRIMQFCKLLHQSREGFLAIVKQHVVITMWLGHDKYQASRGHTFAPLSDYVPATQHDIGVSSFYEAWYMALPNSEIERMGAAYERVQPGDDGVHLPDLIVLTTAPYERALVANVPPNYRLTYSNASFRVWQRSP